LPAKTAEAESDHPSSDSIATRVISLNNQSLSLMDDLVALDCLGTDFFEGTKAGAAFN